MMSLLSHYYSMVQHETILLKSIFTNGVSASLHLALLLVLAVSWIWEKDEHKVDHSEKNGFHDTGLLYYNDTLVCSLAICVFNFLLLLQSYFCWYKYDVIWESDVTIWYLFIKACTWAIVGVYLVRNIRAQKHSFPSFLRFWSWVYASVSCCCLAVEFIRPISIDTIISCVMEPLCLNRTCTFLASDLGSSITGLVLCYCVGLGCSLKNVAKPDPLELEEPLLNGGDSSVRNKTRGNENLTSYSNARFFSFLTFSWITPLITLGNKKTLDHEDLPLLSVDDRASEVFPTFKKGIESECSSAGRVTFVELAKVLFFSAKQAILLSGLLKLLSVLASNVGPYLIDKLNPYLMGKEKSKKGGFILVMAFGAAKLVECFSQSHYKFKIQQVGVRMQSILVAMIYDKGLTLPCQSKELGKDNGEIINLMTIDSAKVGEFCQYMYDPWMALVQVVLTCINLYSSVGVASIPTLFLIVIVIWINVRVASLQEEYRGSLMESKDKRMKETSETLKNMRILKLLVWEEKFLLKIKQHRKIEESWLKKYLLGPAIGFLISGAPTLMAVATLNFYVLTGTIDPYSGKIFSIIAAIQKLEAPLQKLPETFSMYSQNKVSLDRIASFFRSDELQADRVEKLPRGNSDIAIEVVDGRFSWDVSPINPPPALENINLKVFHGMKVAVFGTVGSGKTTLLSCILGEVPKLSGTAKVWGTKANAAQSPWIQSGKIQDIILFGKEMDKEKYEKVIEACALKKDIEALPCRDQTIIGENGVNLSGGQKQRVQIARALYQDADMYLLDDPFSAVDAHTASHLFKECFHGLLKTKTVIYVTHQVEFLLDADLVLVMKEGRITQQAKYDDILWQDTEFEELVRGACRPALPSTERRLTDSLSDFEFEQIIDDKSSDDSSFDPKRPVLVEGEKREKGRTGFNVYWIYISYSGVMTAIVILLFEISAVVFSTFSLYSVDLPLALLSSTSNIIRKYLVATTGCKTATVLFEKMHDSIFRAPMSFFDATPSGRILNSASTDQRELDMSLPNLAWGVVINLILLLRNILMMLNGNLFMMIWFPVMVVVACIKLKQHYTASAVELARLTGTSQAPVIKHFSETISGSTTIRSFDQESRFTDINMKLIDRYSQPKLYSASVREWLSLRCNIISSMTYATFLLLVISFQNPIIPGIAGLAMTYGLNLNSVVVDFIDFLSNLENKLTSVERILDYPSNPSEVSHTIQDNSLNSSWPLLGEVHIQNLKVRYAPHQPLVLRGLTCTFSAGAKIGIVGRTGSGKTTLVHTLCRLVEPNSGQMLIDNVDISLIGTKVLRSRLSIIPQDPAMFEGTVRSNLDPSKKYTDEQIWEALDMCQLGNEIRKKEGKLDSIVPENGENWSMGQRQLICLGRVLLKKSKILILDEATASVDTVTDNIIQQTVKLHFSQCTVITVAHRVTSILESDMVLFLNEGLIKEYDSTEKLLENKSSALAQLVAECTRRSNSGFGS